MIVLNGKGLFGGIVFGRIQFYQRVHQQIQRIQIDNPEKEIERFNAAKARTYAQLQSLYERALDEVGESNAMIFQIHQMLLQDFDYLDSINNIITTHNLNAEYAVAATADNFAAMFASMKDLYMKERAADVRDVSERLISVLMEKEAAAVEYGEPAIIAADDLVPSETVQLDREKVLAFVTARGSAISHTAILARTMSIPAVIGVGTVLTSDYNGMEAIVDGTEGVIYISPDEETIAYMKEKKRQEDEQKALLLQQKGRDNITLDGQEMKLYANIGGIGDIGDILKNDAGGIGLFRSEFLYLESDNFPTEEEQFKAYRIAVEMMEGKRIVIRTLDLGADKQVDYFNLPKEKNPALGCRAIRICLTNKEVFRTQLRAIFRASAYGKLAIMFPMITSLEEVREAKDFAEQVKEELRGEGILFDEEIEIGIMIETPAGAVISDILACEVDFFSVGTNDLTQYTLAIDRQNPMIDKFYLPRHKAILRLLKQVADNAHNAGIKVSVCGELGADVEMTETFLAIGIGALSVPSGMVLPIRKKIRETDIGLVRDGILNEIMN